MFEGERFAEDDYDYDYDYAYDDMVVDEQPKEVVPDMQVPSPTLEHTIEADPEVQNIPPPIVQQVLPTLRPVAEVTKVNDIEDLVDKLMLTIFETMRRL